MTQRKPSFPKHGGRLRRAARSINFPPLTPRKSRGPGGGAEVAVGPGQQAVREPQALRRGPRAPPEEWGGSSLGLGQGQGQGVAGSFLEDAQPYLIQAKSTLFHFKAQDHHTNPFQGPRRLRPGGARAGARAPGPPAPPAAGGTSSAPAAAPALPAGRRTPSPTRGCHACTNLIL